MTSPTCEGRFVVPGVYGNPNRERVCGKTAKVRRNGKPFCGWCDPFAKALRELRRKARIAKVDSHV